MLRIFQPPKSFNQLVAACPRLPASGSPGKTQIDRLWRLGEVAVKYIR